MDMCTNRRLRPYHEKTLYTTIIAAGRHSIIGVGLVVTILIDFLFKNKRINACYGTGLRAGGHLKHRCFEIGRVFTLLLLYATTLVTKIKVPSVT